MKKYILTVAGIAAGLALSLYSAVVPGIPRDSNTGNTGGYDGTRVEAQLLVQVTPDTEVVHFIRDNNDPRVITKTYLLKHVDAYEIRDYLRQMVQAKRVGNTSIVQSYPGNTSTTPVAAVTSSPVLNNVNAQNGYTPQAQLGSNTAVECLKYVDGSGLLIISAEEYRFRDNAGGMGFDSIVAMLDKPELNSLGTGSQMFIYMPKFVPAVNLQSLIQNVGMNISDATELWQGQDLVTADNTLNWLIFDVSNYSCDNIAALLSKYDVPIPQVKIMLQVYEVYAENDERIGIDFQNWKNNEGADFFSVGGRYRNNWAAVYGGAGNLNRIYGSERSSFYNFNPKWNTRYLDFLTAAGKAKIIHSGELIVRNNCSGSFSRTTQIFFSDSSGTPGDAATLPDMGVGPYELLSSLIGEAVKGRNAKRDTADIPVGKGNTQYLTVSGSYGFTMEIKNAVVGLKECRFDASLQNTSLIGFLSDGTPRISQGNVVHQSVSLPYAGDGVFIIGSLTKKEIVESSTGIPWLSDIPYLGYLFSSKSKSVKNSELIVVGKCSWHAPDEKNYGSMTRRYRKP